MRTNALRCQEIYPIKLLDCSNLMINSTDELTTSRRNWVNVLDLKGNLLVSPNIIRLLTAFPNLRVLDLRKNPTLDCQSIQKSRILVKSDCKVTAADIQSLSVSTPSILQSPTLIYTSHKVFPSTPPLLSSFTSATLTLSKTLTTDPTPIPLKNLTHTIILPPTQTLLKASTETIPQTLILIQPKTSFKTLIPTSSLSKTLISTRILTSPPPYAQTLKKSNLRFLLLVIIGPSVGAFLLILCFYMVYKRYNLWC